MHERRNELASNYWMEFDSSEINRKYKLFRARQNDGKYVIVVLFTIVSTAFVIIFQSEPIISYKWGKLYTVTSYFEIVVLILLWIESASRLRLLDSSTFGISKDTLSSWIATLYIIASPVTNSLMLLSRALNIECPADMMHTQYLYCNKEQMAPATNILANCGSCLVNSILFYSGWKYTIISYTITYLSIIMTYVIVGRHDSLVLLIVAISLILAPFIYVGHTLERQSLDLFKETNKNKNRFVNEINTQSLTSDIYEYELGSIASSNSNSTIILEDIISHKNSSQ